MGNTILILGDILEQQVIAKVEELYHEHTNEQLTLNEILRKPFVKYVSRDENKILVEAVNDYRNFFSYTSTDSNYKVGIFNDFDLVSTANQNKLLKLIEDNEGDALQIFISKTDTKILTTIKSRLLTFDYRDNTTLEYPVINEFYQNIIKTQTEINYLIAHDDIYKSMVSIYKYLLVHDYNNAFIIFGKEHFKKIEPTAADIMFRMILNSQLRNNNIEKAREIVTLEKRIYANVDVNLQLEALLIRLGR